MKTSPGERPPDLQRLIGKFGGYWQVPPDVWDRYRAAVREWERKVRAGDRYHQAAQAPAADDRRREGS